MKSSLVKMIALALLVTASTAQAQYPGSIANQGIKAAQTRDAEKPTATVADYESIANQNGFSTADEVLVNFRGVEVPANGRDIFGTKEEFSFIFSSSKDTTGSRRVELGSSGLYSAEELAYAKGRFLINGQKLAAAILAGHKNFMVSIEGVDLRSNDLLTHRSMTIGELINGASRLQMVDAKSGRAIGEVTLQFAKKQPVK